MKFSIQREALLKPLQIVNGVVERRQTLPILSNVLLTLHRDSLSLTGTDLEVEIVTKVDLEGTDEGEITLPARKLLDICRTLPDGARLEMQIDGDKALVRSGRSRFTLATLPAAEYPAIDPIEAPFEFSLAQGVLKQLIERTQFAMAQQDVRYYLNGLLLEIQGDKVRAVATDGHRLAVSEASVVTQLDEPRQVIVPRKGVLELQRLLEDSEAEVRVQIGNNHIKLELGEVSFTSKLIDGRFPDYERVMPRTGEKVIRADRHLLRQAFTRAAVLSNEKYRGIRLQLEDGVLRATVHNPEQEEAEEELEVEYAGGEFEVGFNVNYLLDALGALRSEEVEVHLSDPNSSCLIQGKDEPDSRYVVMPMRL